MSVVTLRGPKLTTVSSARGAWITFLVVYLPFNPVFITTWLCATYFISSIFPSRLGCSCCHPALESAGVALTSSAQGHFLPQKKAKPSAAAQAIPAAIRPSSAGIVLASSTQGHLLPPSQNKRHLQPPEPSLLWSRR
ncbi:hypothetical protein K438DRAFT_1775721 [Mycena galopus ATCC 62051]|nr:hypothetical protein K438DRAFT_1775721 [Mycena galopus ATCC 62051]